MRTSRGMPIRPQQVGQLPREFARTKCGNLKSAERSPGDKCEVCGEREWRDAVVESDAGLGGQHGVKTVNGTLEA